MLIQLNEAIGYDSIGLKLLFIAARKYNRTLSTRVGMLKSKEYSSESFFWSAYKARVIYSEPIKRVELGQDNFFGIAINHSMHLVGIPTHWLAVEINFIRIGRNTVGGYGAHFSVGLR